MTVMVVDELGAQDSSFGMKMVILMDTVQLPKPFLHVHNPKAMLTILWTVMITIMILLHQLKSYAMEKMITATAA